MKCHLKQIHQISGARKLSAFCLQYAKRMRGGAIGLAALLANSMISRQIFAPGDSVHLVGCIGRCDADACMARHLQ
jgi:hypothetical protein